MILRITFSLLLLTQVVFAQEVLTKFSERSLPVLNESLRQKESDINSLKDWYSQKPSTTVTISGGVITVDHSVHAVDTEAAGATDNLDTISSGAYGGILTLSAANSARTVVLKDGTGNLKLSGDCTLDNAEDRALLIKHNDNWYGIACSNNGA